MLNKLIFAILFLSSGVVQAIPDASLDVYRFRSGSEFFIEVSLYIVGSSLTCPPESSDPYGIEYTVIIREEDSDIAAGHRYRLTNTGCPAKDLVDIKRYALKPGRYFIDVELSDIRDTLNKITIKQQTEIKDDNSSAHLSDVQLLSVIRNETDSENPMVKSGLYLEPLPFGYYYPALQQLNVYVETYHADKLEGQPYLQYTLKPHSSDIPSPVVAYRKVAKKSVSANVFQLDIGSLISGPYTLEATLFDGNKQLVTSQAVSFSRYNPEGDSLFIASGSLNLDISFIKKIPEDSLDYHLKAMAPVVNSIEIDIMNALLQKGSVKAKQFFIHRYWTGEAGKYADQAFAAYMKVAKAVDELYRSGFGYGFETDRGHVFLKYGRPDDILPVEDEPSAPPYEIWYYNHFPATHQSNVRFLFYNPSLAKNAYTLLHSTAIGEVKNDRWEIELYRDATLETPGVKDRIMGDNVHRNARKYFENY